MRTQAGIDIKSADPCPILVAALGPKMLELAGEMTEGTITWMTGIDTLSNHTVPTITKAAAAAGRPAPRVLAGIPVCVTEDPDGARVRAASAFMVYGILPSYRAMLDREGLAGPADLALVGSEDEVRAGIEGYAGAGVTDFLAVEFAEAADEQARTRELLRSLL